MGVAIQTMLERMVSQYDFVLQDSRKSVNRSFPILMPKPSAAMILSIGKLYILTWPSLGPSYIWYTQLKNPRCLVLIIIYQTSWIHTFLTLVLFSNTFSLTTFTLKSWWLNNKNSLFRECKLLFAKRI